MLDTMIGNDPTASIVANYLRFALEEVPDKSPLYAKLAVAVANDDELLQLLATLPPEKRQPNLLFGTVRYLFGTPLSASSFQKTVLENWLSIKATMLAKRTQTNEVGRCAVLLPLLAELEAPLCLLEVGASAGLCLLADRYGYDYNGTILQAESSVRLRCSISDLAVPSAVPTVSWRLGLDVHPLSVERDEDRGWLQALVWPGMKDRRANLAAALEIARADPPPLVAGDLRKDFADALHQAPGDGSLVVFHSAVLAYLKPSERAAFVESVLSSSATWIAYEHPLAFVGLEKYLPPLPQTGRDMLVVVDGAVRAVADAHGAFVRGIPAP